MTEEVRRSFRLKDKPAREYAFRNYLKKDYLPPAVIETNKKYDDIFTSVVTNAFLMDVQKTPDEFFAEKRAQMPKVPVKKTRGPYKRRQPVISESMDSEDVIPLLEARLTEIKKQLKYVKGSPKRKKMRTDKKSIDKIEDLANKVEKLVERIERSESSDIEILESPKKTFPCSCGKVFEKHDDCHRHLFEEHCDNDALADCTNCGHRLDDIRNLFVCHVCNKFASNLEEHLMAHYRMSTGRDAIMECRFCVKQFKTVKEVVAHEQEKHMGKCPPRKVAFIYKCNECYSVFANQEHLISHCANHVNINMVWDKIDELQSKVDAQADECPFCRVNWSSRKSFRAHLLKIHWIACKAISKMDLNAIRTDVEIKKEINDLTENVDLAAENLIEVKQEVKEELTDDGYPIYNVE